MVDAVIFVLILIVWDYRLWLALYNKQNRLTFTAAFFSFVFVVIEGLLGAGLVLTGNTAENLTPERPLWMAAHLVNTFILLAYLTLTARYASGGRPIYFRTERKYLAA